MTLGAMKHHREKPLRRRRHLVRYDANTLTRTHCSNIIVDYRRAGAQHLYDVGYVFCGNEWWPKRHAVMQADRRLITGGYGMTGKAGQVRHTVTVCVPRLRFL